MTNVTKKTMLTTTINDTMTGTKKKPNVTKTNVTIVAITTTTTTTTTTTYLTRDSSLSLLPSLPLLSFAILSFLRPSLSASATYLSPTFRCYPSIAGSTNPQLLRLINSHQQRFIEMLNEPADAAAPVANAPGGGGGPGAGKALG